MTPCIKIYLTYSDLKNKTNKMTCIFFNREREVQFSKLKFDPINTEQKKQKYLHVLLVLQPFLYLDINVKAIAHSFKQFTSRLLKLSFLLSMHLYTSDGRHA